MPRKHGQGAYVPPLTLGPAELSTVVRRAPMVSIDLITRNARGQVLLGFAHQRAGEGILFRTR
jgi:hypothetical protein